MSADPASAIRVLWTSEDGAVRLRLESRHIEPGAKVFPHSPAGLRAVCEYKSGAHWYPRDVASVEGLLMNDVIPSLVGERDGALALAQYTVERAEEAVRELTLQRDAALEAHPSGALSPLAVALYKRHGELAIKQFDGTGMTDAERAELEVVRADLDRLDAATEEDGPVERTVNLDQAAMLALHAGGKITIADSKVSLTLTARPMRDPA